MFRLPLTVCNSITWGSLSIFCISAWITADMAENMDNVSVSGSDTEVRTSSRCMEYAKAARVGLPSQKNNATRRLFDPDNGLPHRPCTAIITQRCLHCPKRHWNRTKLLGMPAEEIQWRNHPYLPQRVSEGNLSYQMRHHHKSTTSCHTRRGPPPDILKHI